MLTSTGNDHFSKMTRVSVASVRLTNPDYKIILCCDEATGKALEACNDYLLTETDEVRVIETPSGKPVYKNRFIKTQLRLLIKGDFLFLDSDILVCGRIDEQLNKVQIFGAAPNHSTQEFESQIWQDDQQALTNMGWKLSGDVYLNGGVLFYRDVPACRLLATHWHKNWLKSATVGSYRDQPSLNYSVFLSEIPVTVLPVAFNAQFGITPVSSIGAVLLHFYASNDSLTYTHFMQYVNQLKNDEKISEFAIHQMINRNCPFLDDGVMRKFLIWDIYRKNNILKYHEYALQGRWGWSLLSYIKHTFSGNPGKNKMHQ